MQEVYKAVMRVSSDTTCFVSLRVRGTHQVTYVPGQEVCAPHLFVFQTLADARMAVTETSACIWRCRTPETYAPPPCILDAALLDLYGTSFWSGGSDCINPLFLSLPPAGTVLCDSLTLLEQM